MLRIRHPQILALQAICESNELLYLVNEYAEVKISDLLTERNYFVENQARSVIRSLLRALSYLHSLQIIHRGYLKMIIFFFTWHFYSFKFKKIFFSSSFLIF